MSWAIAFVFGGVLVSYLLFTLWFWYETKNDPKVQQGLFATPLVVLMFIVFVIWSVCAELKEKLAK